MTKRHDAPARRRRCSSAAILLGPAIVRRASQARPARAGPQPGHVRRRDGGGARPRCSSCATSLAGAPGLGFSFQIIAWLWFTVLFANFAEAMAEGRGKAQADTLRRTRTRDRRPSACIGDRRDVCEPVPATDAQGRRPRAGRGGRPDPRATARSSRASPRSTKSAITGESRAGDPRERRRPLGRDRRHPRPLRLDQGPDHGRRTARPSSTA